MKWYYWILILLLLGIGVYVYLQMSGKLGMDTGLPVSTTSSAMIN